ncbi:MAG: hypothetical protein RSE34_07860, partial [Brevundimonas sp.]
MPDARRAGDVSDEASACMKPNTLRGNVWIIRNPIAAPVRNPFMSYPAADRLKIAVIGSGVAALSSAWLLS